MVLESKRASDYLKKKGISVELINLHSISHPDKQMIYKSVKNKSSKLNRARPRSLSSSIVYYWILKNSINISLKEFSKKVELSELTIQKNIKEITNVFSL